jgi:hypothetical protein
MFFVCCYIDRADEEEEEPIAHRTAPTSTSNTLVLSEEHHAVMETSPPPQHKSNLPTPVPSPRALLAKKAKTVAGDTGELATGNASTSLLEDVIFLSIFFARRVFVS